MLAASLSLWLRSRTTLSQSSIFPASYTIVFKPRLVPTHWGHHRTYKLSLSLFLRTVGYL